MEAAWDIPVARTSLSLFVHSSRNISSQDGVTVKRPPSPLKDGDGMLDYEELLAFASKKKRARGHGQDAKGGGGILSKLKKKVRRKRMSTPRARSNPPPLPGR